MDELMEEYNAWLVTRPQVIQDMAASHPPFHYYRMQSTGQLVSILAFSEDRTVRVHVHDELGLMDFEVFGVDIDDLAREGTDG